MNQFNVILALIFSLVIAIFALANNQPIIVNYLYGKTEISAVIVILGAAILGALTMFLLNIFKQIKTGWRLRNIQGQVNDLTTRVDELTDERDALLMQIGQLQQSPETYEEAPEAEQPPVTTSEPLIRPYAGAQETGGDGVPAGDGFNYEEDAAHIASSNGDESAQLLQEERGDSDREEGFTEKEDEKGL